MNLGIKKDLVAKAGIPIDPPLILPAPQPYFKSHKFPIVRLESVVFDPAKITKDKQTDEETSQPVLIFTFADTTNKEKKITDMYYPIQTDDDKWEMKLDALQKSIKHIFEEAVGADKFKEEDFTGSSFAELFENSANAFNKTTVTFQPKKGDEEAKPTEVAIYKTTLMYLKLTYYKGRLGTTMFPNFVQKAYSVNNGVTTQLTCELSVGKADEIVNKADAKPAANSMGGARDNPLGGMGAFDMMDGVSDMVFPTDN